MTRKQAVKALYDLMNSAVLNEEIEDSLQETANAICYDGFDKCRRDETSEYCEGCNHLED